MCSSDLNRIFRQVKKAYKELSQQIKPVWQQWAEAIILMGSLAFVLKTHVFGLYQVPTGSAEPNILVGDRLYGNKLIYKFKEIELNDYIICDNPEFNYDRSSTIQELWQRYIGFPIWFLGLKAGPDNWTKRVLAVPGDTIEGRVVDGKTYFYRNGKEIEEQYINPLPLIAVEKEVGLIDPDSFFSRFFPRLLHKKKHQVRYTYDQIGRAHV